jgi:hypothetical protein
MLQTANKGDMQMLGLGKLFPVLLFALDVLIMPSSTTGTQQELDALQDICKVGLTG